ncbi:hypothetical protein SRHO_G00049530 [Serrasalmus rhombeus]
MPEAAWEQSSQTSQDCASSQFNPIYFRADLCPGCLSSERRQTASQQQPGKGQQHRDTGTQDRERQQLAHEQHSVYLRREISHM